MARADWEKHAIACGQGLAKCADDEPVFVLRAQDQLAPAVVDAWANAVEAATHDIEASLKAKTLAKVREARALAYDMRAWQLRNHCKLPD